MQSHSSDEPAPFALPEQFGPYRIIRPLGKGGMGTVFLAHDTRLDREVALKVRHLADNPLALERFRREAKAAASLSHPNLCPVYEFDVRDYIAYIAMAFIEGPTLSVWVAQHGRPSRRAAALLVAKLALAMQEAHDAGVIHRDLKPANLIINRRSEPIVLDFGLARQMDDPRTRLTKPGEIHGTPRYMSPEQVSGDLALMGPASDLYSLGVILYELLTGEVPFHGPVAVVLGKLLHSTPRPLCQINPEVDSTLQAVCLTALAKKPGDRYPSMTAFSQALMRAARSLPPASRAASPPPLPKRKR